MTKYGYRVLLGSCPPENKPTRIALYWRQVSELKFIFFTRIYVENFGKWLPCDSTVRMISGGSRVPLSQFDRGNDSLHTVLVWAETEDDMSFQVEIKDHRSIQHFTRYQLSNFTDEKTAENVEHWSSRDGLDTVL